MNDTRKQILAGADIHAGGGYSIGTKEEHDKFVRARNQSLAKSRVRELAKQAGFYVSANGAEILIPDPHTEDITVVMEKFAELIVKETLQVARAGIEYGNGMEDAVYRYFGVEE